jgi:ubiquinone/menaquinone biosynthesis C-methylase UbiE
MDSELRDRLRNSYNAQAQKRDGDTIQAWQLEERANFMDWLRKENKHALLEIGPGTGKDSLFFQDQGLETVCIDLSPEMVNLCRRKGLTAYVMDMTDIRFPDHSFDAVYALNSLLHVPKTEMPAVLQRISAILSPSGLFYLGMYGAYDFEGIREEDKYIPKRFFSFYSTECLKQVVSQVFDIAYFKLVLLERADKLHFQSLILRQRA